MDEKKEKKLTIQVDSRGRSNVFIGDGYDISGYLEAIEFTCKTQRSTVVKLKLSPWVKVIIDRTPQ